jgi:hypothetical protein
MPKTRKTRKSIGFSKQINKTNHVLRIKSGILSSNDRKVAQQDQLEFSFFDDELIHLDNDVSKKDYSYNENRTIFFNRKNVVPTVRLENNPYIYNNALSTHEIYNDRKILATPNIPSFYYQYGVSNDTELGVLSDDVMAMDQTSDIYDRMLKEKYLKTETRAFNEKTNWDDTLKSENYNTITIDYDLHKSPRPDLYLSFSKKENTRQVIFPGGKSFYTFNGNTAYFYNNDYTTDSFGPFDYLGNISENYKLNINNFLSNSPVCFNSVTVSNNNIAFVYPQWGGIPVDTFGFPYSNKFDAAPRHLIPASNYITKPFVIEKVCIEFEMSNWSFVNHDIIGGEMPCINFVNFFVLNQRGKKNINNLESNKSVKYYDNGNNSINVVNSYSGNTIYTTNNKSNNETYTEQEIQDIKNGIAILGFEDYLSSSINTLLRTDKIEEVDKNIEKNTKNQQRDLITTISIANYSDPLDNGTYVNKEKIKSIVDEFVDQSNVSRIGLNSQSECIYTNRKFKITAPVKYFYENKKLPKFTSFNIYPENQDSTRTNLNIKSGRSLYGENLNNVGSNSLVNDQYFNSSLIKEFDFEESNYILHPSDNLILGVSLSNEYNTGEDSSGNAAYNFGEDLVKISCSEDYPLKLHLIGYYLEDKNKKVIVNKTTKQFKNTKRIGYYQNEVVDQIGSNLGYLSQNFYDYWFKDAASRVPFGETEKNFTLSPYYRQDEFTYSNFNKTRLGNFSEIPNLSFGRYNLNGGITYLFPGSSVPNILNDTLLMNTDLFNSEIYKEKQNSNFKLYRHYYNKYHFGYFCDRLNHNRIYQFSDAKYQNIIKKFMNGFCRKKTAAKVKGKISFDFTGIHEYTGKNFITEKIFNSSSPYTWSPDGGTTYITLDLAVLEVNIKDENDKKVKFIFQIPVFEGITDEKTIYTAGGLGTPNKEYIDDTLVYTSTLAAEYFEDFVNLNYNTTISIANYGQNRILSMINSLITAMIEILKTGFTLAGINITPSINQNSTREFIDVDFEINSKGKLNSANLQAGTGVSNVSYENFAIEEGDLLNSYNITSNSLYNDSDIAFKDS